MINEEDYDLLQKALRQEIRDSFDDRYITCSYDATFMGPPPESLKKGSDRA